MSNRYRLLAATLLAVSLPAQENQTATIRGHLSAGSSLDGSGGLVIELTNLATRATLGRIELAVNGDFTARHVPFGEYLARVATFHGDTVAQQFVTVNQPTTQLELQLPERPRIPAGTTVSARELKNPPRRRAFDASLAAQRFSESGQFDKAAVELEKAVRISPDYALAHSNLGAQYLRLQRYEEGAAEIRRAIEIAGPNVNDLSNLAYAQLLMERFGEAAATARAALKLKKDSATAHHVLGLALVLDPATRGEGIAHLEEAAKTLDGSRRALAALGR
jgi:tetratricopeptide (TPR) repeat protein